MLKVCARRLHISARRMVNWNESEILIDRKSKFQGRCTVMNNVDELEKLLEDLVSNDKSVQKASHKTMYAWRTGHEANGKVTPTNQGLSDCGESGAGMRLMSTLERLRLVNVLVVVTRWYGGTALGPARFRHISTTAVDSLKIGGFLKVESKRKESDSKDKKKLKKKK